jgi:regulatory protein
MSRRNFASSRRTARPLDRSALDALAIAYLGRYATTRARLRDYLARKVAARGWQGEGEPPIGAVVERCAELGYVDDASFAAARGAALTRRGYGEQRVAAALRALGVDAETAAPAREAARGAALAAALAFARRRRIGPYGSESISPDERRRHLAALLRAGHAPDIARLVAYAETGATLIEDEQNLGSTPFWSSEF